METQPDRILLIQTRWMGDVLLATPAIRAVRHAFPDARIDFLTEAAGAAVLRDNPYLDAVLVDPRSLRLRIALWKEIRATEYDAVVDFRSTNSTAQATFASRARIRIGVSGRGPRRFAYTQFAGRLEIPTYAARHKVDMLSGIGVPVQYINDLSLDLALRRDDRMEAREFWTKYRLGDRPVVAVTPVSRESFKQWGEERWAHMADRLMEQGNDVILTHGPGERDQIERVVAAMKYRPIWDFSTPTVQSLAAILERCEWWVGNEGGAKHIAAAVGTRTFAVSRWQIGPVWTDTEGVADQHFIDKAPPKGCDLRCDRCRHLGCLRSLSEREVADALDYALL